jgi:hypothetical protein
MVARREFGIVSEGSKFYLGSVFVLCTPTDTMRKLKRNKLIIN